MPQRWTWVAIGPSLPLGTSVLLAVAVSLDSFAVGAAYGMRGIRISAGSLLIIASCTATMLAGSMTLGHWFAQVLTPEMASKLGGLLLMLLGLWQVMQTRPQHRPTILRKPEQVDRNHSGVIDARESLLLGIALGLDAVAAGLGAAMIGFAWHVVPLTTMAAVLFLLLGSWCGRRPVLQMSNRRGQALPGVLLLLLGLWQLT